MKLSSLTISIMLFIISIYSAWQCDAKEVAMVDKKTASTTPAKKQSPPAFLPWVVSPTDSTSLPTPIREEVEAVHIGMTREEFDQHFCHDNGLCSLFYVGKGDYHCLDGNQRVHLTVTFEVSDPAGNMALFAKSRKYHGLYLTEEERHMFLFGNLHDTIVEVSSPWIFGPVHAAP